MAGELAAVESDFAFTLPAEAERRQLEASMTEALLQAARSMARRVGTSSARVLLNCVQVGAQILQIREDQTSVYGEDAMGKLAAYFRVDKAKLYNYARVAEIFEADRLKDYLYEDKEQKHVRRTAGGGLLCFGHLLQIAQMKTTEDPYAMVQRVYEKGFSTNQLRAELAVVEKKVVRAGGRKPQRPPTPAALIHTTEKLLNKLNNFATENGTQYEQLVDLSDSEISSDLLELVTTAIDANSEAIATLTLVGSHLGTARKRVEKILNEREDRQAREDEEVAPKPPKPVAAAPKAAPAKAALPAKASGKPGKVSKPAAPAKTAAAKVKERTQLKKARRGK